MSGPRPDTAPKRQGRKSGAGWMVATILLACALGLSLMGNFVSAIFSVPTTGSSMTAPGFQEVVLEDNDSRNKVAVIVLDGIISGQSFDASGYNLVSYIEDQLEACTEDDRVRAVLLKVNSPGGEVLASDEIYRLIADFQETTGKPVIASMGSLAASGGYYISAPCRWIVAHELTITGSIGVIMSGYNWRGLMDKVGVQPMVFKSGDLKDMLSPDKRPDEITSEERELVQGMVMETFDRFKTVIKEGRTRAADANDGEGRVLADNWEQFADGRIISGKEAHRLGLVDELGNFDAAIERALELAGISSANLIAYRQPFRLGMLFRLLGESESRTVKLDLGVKLPQIESGRLYFLPPHFVP